MNLRAPATGAATYPDLAVLCGEPQVHPEDAHAATNPVLLVEVLCSDTEAWDRGGKFTHYRQLPLLRHYLLVSQDDVRVEHFERQAGGIWTFSEHGGGQVVRLDAVGVELNVDEVFADLPGAQGPGSAGGLRG